MFKFFFCTLLSVLLFQTIGCRSVKADKDKHVPGLSDFGTLDPEAVAQLRVRAEHFTRAMAESFRSGDFKYWREALEKEGPAGKPLIVDEKKFNSMARRLKENWGDFIKCTYLGELDQSILRDFVWKCTFESRDDAGKLIRIEELFVVRCTVLRGKAVFTNFGFRFFNNPEFRRQVIQLKKAEVQKNEKTD